MLLTSEYWLMLKHRRNIISPIRLFNFSLYAIYRPFINWLHLKKVFYAPVSAFMWTTSRCNKKCSFCMYDDELNKEKSDDLTLERFSELILTGPFLRNLHLAFYGGEPFLNKDLFKMIRAAKEKGLITTVTTNGNFLEPRAKELAESPPDFITVSYYPENHELLKRGLATLPSNTVRKLNFILSKQTIEHIEAALELAVKNNMDVFGIDPISDRNRNHSEVIFENSLEMKALKKKINGQVKGTGLRVKWPKTKTEIKKNHTSCFFMWDTVYMTKNGDWGPCSEWTLKSYQKRDAFVWNSSWYQEQRANHFVNGKTNKFCQNCIYKFDSSMNL